MIPLLYGAVFFYIAAYALIFIYHIKGGVVLERASRISIILGLVLHTGTLGIRTFETGHAPMASMFETLLFYSWATVLVSVVVILRYNERFTELITAPAALLAIVFSFFNETEGKPLTLILRTRWFETHVTSSFAAYALFTLAFSAACLYIIFGFKKYPRDELKRTFQDIAARSILWGFFFFSASMFSGAVWGYLAWGAYWMWEPKIIWSFIVWFYYAGAMHAYFVREWRGMGLSIATASGFFIVIFTYLGISLLMKSSHSF
ncbi:MAG: cytochrome c biogenesis protein CcsA [Deltaproteobacteria bacterium]|nr:cytochrome c biogenesis protein CcsA [Deltaproteobacteria bacterium]